MWLRSVKKLFAIFCSLSLLWMQFAPTLAAASTRPQCRQLAAGKLSCCGACCGAGADCCVAHPNPGSQPVPAGPTPAGAQNQLLIFASILVTWTAPQNLPGPVSSVSTVSALATVTPLYERHCALLL
jgi:hypothetical protein